MPKNYKLLFQARNDLRDILSYIGQERTDLTDKNVRFYSAHRNYMIIYNPIVKPIEIIRIYNTARNIDLVLH